MIEFFFIIGIICVIISAIFLGAWTSGNRQRENFHSETSEHKTFRTRIASYTGWIGLLFLCIAGFLYFL